MNITRTYTVKWGIITMRGNSSVVEHIDITDEVPGSNPGYFSSNYSFHYCSTLFIQL